MTAVAENAADNSTPEAIHSVWPRWLRLPSFAFWCSKALLVCIAYLGWIIIDAQFPMTVFVVRHSVGLQQLDPDTSVVAYGLWGMMWDGVRSWDSLGPRLLLFVILAITAVTDSLLMLLQFLRRATIRRMLLIVLVICAWLSLLMSYRQVNEWAVLRRAKSALSRFELAANPLSQHWPTENGILPEAGRFYTYSDKHPDLLLLHGRKNYPIREDFGHIIEQSEQGAIRFDLSGATDCQIEFHPDGSTPASYSTKLSRSTMTPSEVIKLKENWYLVRYGGS